MCRDKLCTGEDKHSNWRNMIEDRREKLSRNWKRGKWKKIKAGRHNTEKEGNFSGRTGMER